MLRLPLTVRLVAQESTASFARRLAQANGLALPQLLETVGDGNTAPQPQYNEVYLNADALERLAQLARRPPRVLQGALPNLRAHHLLQTGPGARWHCPQWEARGVFLVEACALCTASKGVPYGVYLVSPSRWRVCVRHGRWLDNLREAGVGWLPLRELPEVGGAHRERVRLERRLGGGGRALFADALHLTAFWWNVPRLRPPAWEERHRRLERAGPVGSELRVAPLAAYPEAVHLARLLAQRERRRMRGSWSAADEREWCEKGAAGALTAWSLPGPLALAPLHTWLQQHTGPVLPGGIPPPARGRYRRLPAPLPHPELPADAHLEEASCLPWRFGDVPEGMEAPGGWAVSGRA